MRPWGSGPSWVALSQEFDRAGQAMFISFSGAEEVTTYVTISWEESEDENLKNYPTNIN